MDAADDFACSVAVSDNTLESLATFIPTVVLFAIYIVWSIFIYRAASDPLAHKMFLDFTAWANLAHGIAMVPHALMIPGYHIKFLTDIPWVVLPAIAIAFLRPSSSQRRN